MSVVLQKNCEYFLLEICKPLQCKASEAKISGLKPPDKKKPCNRNGYRASSLLSRYEGKIGLDTDLDTAVLFSQQCLQRIGRRTLIFLQSMSVNIKSNAGMSMTEPFRNRSNIRFRRDQERC